jgi:hypothetical protein
MSCIFSRRNSLPDHNVLELGARGDGQTNDAAAIQAVIDTCTQAGSGRVLLRNCEANFAPGLPQNYRHAVEAHQVHDLVLESSEAALPGPARPAGNRAGMKK